MFSFVSQGQLVRPVAEKQRADGGKEKAFLGLVAPVSFRNVRWKE